MRTSMKACKIACIVFVVMILWEIGFQCGTVTAIRTHKPYQDPIVYSGLRLDMRSIGQRDHPDNYSVIMSYLAILDVPFSLLLDTAILPITVPWAIYDHYAEPAGLKLLRFAAAGDLQKVKKALENGATIDFTKPKSIQHRTALIEATVNGHIEIVKFLLEKGATVDIKSERNLTALAHAAECGQEEIVKLLLKKGAALEIPDALDRTPLTYAARKGNYDIVKMLVEKGAQVDKRSKGGSTPLMEAIKYSENEDTPLYLIEAGASVNVKAEEGLMPLHLAIIYGRSLTMQRLIEKEADVNALYRGSTPLSLLQRYTKNYTKEDWEENRELLKKAGAQRRK